jgi:predicted TPR repeat methyltransferase
MNPDKTIAERVQEAFTLHKAGRLDEAGALYARVLEAAPDHPDALHLSGLVAHQKGNHREAAGLIRRALAVNPSPRYHNNLATVLLALGDFNGAAAACRMALSLNPQHVEAHFNLGNALEKSGGNETAAAHYRAVLQLRPDHRGALSRLQALVGQAAEAHLQRGIEHLNSGQAHEAIPCFQAALNLNPHYLEAHNNLALSQHQLAHFTEAAASFNEALRINPNHPEVLNNFARTLRELGNVDEAIYLCRKALELRPDHADVYGNLGGLLLMQNKKDEALAAFRRQAQLDPRNPVALHQIATLSGARTEKAPARYVESVFDDYANKFDAHLVEGLHYHAPEKLAAFIGLHLAPPASQWDILDLGCGTGLSGAAIASYSRSLTGVDLSANMLEKARARNLYRRLERQDISAFLRAEPAQYDLLFATDVFIYIGKLDEVMQEAKRILREGGAFAFSVERLQTDADYRLNPTGRYAQSLPYLERLAREFGFAPPITAETILRVESNVPVDGLLVLLKRAG